MASISQVVATPDVHGPSYTRPPFFYGTDYAYWRNKMEMFLDSEGVNLWDIIEEGWSPPTRKNSEGNEVVIPRKEWSDEQTKANLRNRKAIIILYCGLSREEYNEIEYLRSAKEIWECLKTKHEGTSESNDDDTDGEVANLCFMALEEPSSDEVTLDLESNDEIVYAYKKLIVMP